MSAEFNKAVVRIMSDTMPITESQLADTVKAVGDGDLLAWLVEKKKLGEAQATKLRGKAQEVIEGPRIPNWTIIRKLGQGGMGAVFKAQHSVMTKRVAAMKVLAPNLAKNQEFVARFEREAKSAGVLEHPNVIGGLDYGKTETGEPYFAMEFVDGYSVKDVMDKSKTLKIGDALKVVRDVTLALVHAAENKLVHRDIKPDNIMITKQGGVVKLADLGLAKQTDEENSMTQTGSGFGTPYYMPPEQARNAKYVDARSDIYALGATLYHMITGKVPFDGDTALEVLMKKQKGTFPKPSAANPDVPSQVNLLVDKMMAMDPAQRFQSAEELLQQLDTLGLHAHHLSFVDGPPVDLSKTPAPSRATTPPSAGKTAPLAKPPSSPNRPSAATAPPSEEYFLRYKDAKGKQVKTHMPKSRVLHMIKNNQLDETVEVATSPNGPFRKLAAFPEFEPFLRSRIAAKKAEETGGKAQSKMTDLIANFDKVQSRHQLKKSVKNLGFNIVSFVVAGVLFVGGCYGIYMYIVKPALEKNAAGMKAMEEETKRNKETMGS
jgi:serine/threonine-protein kinase